MKAKVAIERCGEYDAEKLYRTLKSAAQAADFPNAKGKTVLLKPNIVMDATPEKAITTHPLFLEAAIRIVREWGVSRILVGDSPGLQGPNFTARNSRLGETAKRCGAEWVDFARSSMELNCPEGKVQRRFTVSKVLQSVDWVISLPKLKTHQLMYYTGAMKNIFGFILSAAKSSYHVRYPSREDFAAMIVDLNVAVKPVFAFMDAVIAMEGPGPSAGYPKQVGLVMASSNLLAMDIAASSIIGYPPQMIPVIRDALSRGIWLKDLPEIEYPLLKPGEVMIKDFIKIPFKKSENQLLDFVIPRPLKKLVKNQSPLPVIDDKVCVRCGDCVKICASSAMRLEGEGTARQVKIDKSRCIRCYCCHEICPLKAIAVSKR
ncbi:MAG: DUF362 domain-containing protein [Treponema sp.]|jgi:uncharacterized protein (DUF362 family)/Pyruvate/2-oxoacid:ferredoxin oxidoreductase delta subunit|nr:DUF362 domain-containing protein [Treponema sp.]